MNINKIALYAIGVLLVVIVLLFGLPALKEARNARTGNSLQTFEVRQATTRVNPDGSPWEGQVTNIRVGFSAKGRIENNVLHFMDKTIGADFYVPAHAVAPIEASASETIGNDFGKVDSADTETTKVVTWNDLTFEHFNQVEAVTATKQKIANMIVRVNPIGVRIMAVLNLSMTGIYSLTIAILFLSMLTDNIVTAMEAYAEGRTFTPWMQVLVILVVIVVPIIIWYFTDKETWAISKGNLETGNAIFRLQKNAAEKGYLIAWLIQVIGFVLIGFALFFSVAESQYSQYPKGRTRKAPMQDDTDLKRLQGKGQVEPQKPYPIQVENALNVPDAVDPNTLKPFDPPVKAMYDVTVILFDYRFDASSLASILGTVRVGMIISGIFMLWFVPRIWTEFYNPLHLTAYAIFVSLIWAIEFCLRIYEAIFESKGSNWVFVAGTVAAGLVLCAIFPVFTLPYFLIIAGVMGSTEGRRFALAKGAHIFGAVACVYTFALFWYDAALYPLSAIWDPNTVSIGIEMLAKLMPGG